MPWPHSPRSQARRAAQDWPNRPVTLVVPYAAGGPVDTIARIIAARLSEILGQQMVIENVGGAGGMTGTARVAKAAPDGYTLLLSGSAVLAQNPTFHKQPPYDPIADFAHVALFSDSARVLIARKDFPPNDFKEFMAYAKAEPEHAAIRLARRGLGRRTPARSCSTARWAPRSPTCPIAAPVPRCRTCSAAASTTCSSRFRPPRRRSRPAP